VLLVLLVRLVLRSAADFVTSESRVSALTLVIAAISAQSVSAFDIVSARVFKLRLVRDANKQE